MKSSIRNLVIIPSRGRPGQAQNAADLAQSLGPQSRVVLAVDADEEGLYSGIRGHLVMAVPTTGLTNALNYVATKHAPDFETITFLGDDHLVRTFEWDVMLSRSIQERGYGLSYGNDMNMGEVLPTFIMISTNVIKVLGHVAPPSLSHMFIDNYWKEIGDMCTAIDYHPEVVVEHMHHSLGKSEFDQTYASTNTHLNNLRTKLKYLIYKKTILRRDARKILALKSQLIG